LRPAAGGGCSRERDVPSPLRPGSFDCSFHGAGFEPQDPARRSRSDACHRGERSRWRMSRYAHVVGTRSAFSTFATCVSAKPVSVGRALATPRCAWGSRSGAIRNSTATGPAPVRGAVRSRLRSRADAAKPTRVCAASAGPTESSVDPGGGRCRAAVSAIYSACDTTSCPRVLHVTCRRHALFGPRPGDRGRGPIPVQNCRGGEVRFVRTTPPGRRSAESPTGREVDLDRFGTRRTPIPTVAALRRAVTVVRDAASLRPGRRLTPQS
jgi:hypothetical protein